MGILLQVMLEQMFDFIRYEYSSSEEAIVFNYRNRTVQWNPVNTLPTEGTPLEPSITCARFNNSASLV